MRRPLLLLLLAACGSPSATTDAPAGGDSPGGGGSDAAGDGGTMPRRLHGTNMSGAEFGEQNLPGTFGTDYIYLDSDYSGSHTQCQSATIGADSLANFTAWLRANGKRGMLGELGASAESTCLSAVDGMLAHVDANSDVYLGWTWWSAGPWWGNYFMTLEPTNNTDAPQLATLAAHL